MAKNYNSNLQTNNTDLQEVLQTLQTKATVGQATPVITVNSSTGLITATAGTKSATHQLAFKAAQTITPTTTNQTIAANTYLGGVQTIKGDANLVASNIVSGKSIFGVVGTYGAGSDTSMEDGLIARTVTNYTNSRVTEIGYYAFAYCYSLTSISLPNVIRISSYAFARCNITSSVNFPKVTTIGNSAFEYCDKITSINLPMVTIIGSDTFNYCSQLTSVSLPKVTQIGSNAFKYCSQLTSVSLPKVATIYRAAFSQCTRLTTIYLLGSSVCSLGSSDVFTYAGITSSTGSIFVPTSLVSKYKSATIWAYFSNRIFGM